MAKHKYIHIGALCFLIALTTIFVLIVFRGDALAGGTCEGYCGGESVYGCWCDKVCVDYGDCCPDYEDKCVYTVPPSPPPTLSEGMCTPTWHRTLPASERFLLVMNGEAVLDKETGLVWEKCPSTVYSRTEAISHCADLNVGGRKGWHLPKIEQLASLVDTSNNNPALPSGHPFSNVQSSYYWSATTNVSGTNDVWVVDFRYGHVSAVEAGGYHAWCVRGGESHNAY